MPVMHWIYWILFMEVLKGYHLLSSDIRVTLQQQIENVCRVIQDIEAHKKDSWTSVLYYNGGKTHQTSFTNVKANFYVLHYRIYIDCTIFTAIYEFITSQYLKHFPYDTLYKILPCCCHLNYTHMYFCNFTS